jgi:uncharacterized protein
MHFAPARFLRNPHLQTVWGRITRPRTMVRFLRERLTTPDDDELVLDHLDAPVTAAKPIHFILLHGLEGSSYSVYIQGALSVIEREGHRASVLNFRSCARDPHKLSRMLPNRRPRFYHSGETGDFDFVLRTLHARTPDATFVAFGTSLGGNMLLKWLGEHPGQTLLRAAATMSVPYDLGAGSDHLDATRMGRFYVRTFIRSLKPKVARVIRDFPELARDLQLERSMHTTSFRSFDDYATAPLHGFRDADDYYTRSSSIHYLAKITTPTLLISSEDDPFVPAGVLPRVREALPPGVELITTDCGGHAGFIGGAHPWKCEYWAEEHAVKWLIASAER